jgi:four helix bundle protein
MAQRQDLKARAFEFAANILNLYKRLSAGGPAHAHMAQQLFEAASSIGAQLEEAEVANSRRDLASKHAIALRESRESNFWLRMFATIPEWRQELAPLVQESLEFVRDADRLGSQAAQSSRRYGLTNRKPVGSAKTRRHLDIRNATGARAAISRQMFLAWPLRIGARMTTNPPGPQSPHVRLRRDDSRPPRPSGGRRPLSRSSGPAAVRGSVVDRRESGAGRGRQQPSRSRLQARIRAA